MVAPEGPARCFAPLRVSGRSVGFFMVAPRGPSLRSGFAVAPSRRGVEGRAGIRPGNAAQGFGGLYRVVPHRDVAKGQYSHQPYVVVHDGQAASLEAMLDSSEHGGTDVLTDRERRWLARYLLEIE